MNAGPMIRGVICVAAGFAVRSNLHAQDSALAFLLHPEAVLSGVGPGSETTLAPEVDGTSLSFAAPRIAYYKNTDQAEFVSAVWNDASGRALHQRDVLFLKPDYGVIVDYIYGTGRHTIVRESGLPSGKLIKVTSDKNGAQSSEGDGETFRLQAIDPTSTASLAGDTVTFTSTAQIPAPIPTVFLAWAGAAPRVEYVKPANPMIVKFKVTYPTGQVDEIAVAWEPRALHLSGREFKGWAACLRTGPAGVSSMEIH
jgi:hypothetical protein